MTEASKSRVIGARQPWQTRLGGMLGSGLVQKCELHSRRREQGGAEVRSRAQAAEELALGPEIAGRVLGARPLWNNPEGTDSV